MRIVTFVRTKSPLYSSSAEEIVRAACSFLEIPALKNDHTKLLVVEKWDQLSIFVFDVFYSHYDPLTGHNAVDLSVILVDYGRRYSSVRFSTRQFRDKVNHDVAKAHDNNGWDARPPYFIDRREGRVPVYYSPRSMKVRGKCTGPPGSGDSEAQDRRESCREGNSMSTYQDGGSGNTPYPKTPSAVAPPNPKRPHWDSVYHSTGLSKGTSSATGTAMGSTNGELPSSYNDQPGAHTKEYAQSLDARDPLKDLRGEFIIPSKADLKRKTLAKQGYPQQT